MWVNPHFYLVYSHLLNKFLTEKFIFLHWFVQVNRQKTAVKKKITYFLKGYVASLSTFFWKSLCNFQIFYRSVFGCKVLRLSVFYLFKFSPQYWYLPLCKEKMCWVGVFNKREETFAVSLPNRKSCVCIKYLTLFRPRKLISVSFAFLYSM